MRGEEVQETDSFELLQEASRREACRLPDTFLVSWACEQREWDGWALVDGRLPPRHGNTGPGSATANARKEAKSSGEVGASVWLALKQWR